MKYFNSDYFAVFKEAGIIERCASNIERITECNNGKVLFIVPCLIGDFVATLPAIVNFIERHLEKTFDIVVAPNIKVLAEKIVGIGNVYGDKNEQIHGKYEEVIILRSNHDVLINIVPYIKAQHVITKTREIAKYSLFELFKNNILRKRPMQWRDFNFTLLGGISQHMSIEQIFSFTAEDYKRISKFPVISNIKTNIIIHTGASWPMMYWPKENWVSLLEKLNKSGDFNFIFIGSKKESADYEYIASHLSFFIHSTIGNINLLDLTLLFTHCQLFLGIDSGPGNIAHLVGLRSIIIYGPGPHTFMSHHKNDVIIDKSRGRGLYQRFFIKKKGFIHKITVSEVYDAFQKLILTK